MNVKESRIWPVLMKFLKLDLSYAQNCLATLTVQSVNKDEYFGSGDDFVTAKSVLS